MIPSEEAKFTLALLLEHSERGTTKLQPKWRVILPHVGLVFLLGTYILAGAIVFYFIENPYEGRIMESSEKNMAEKRKMVADEIWKLTESPEVTNFEEFEAAAKDKIDDYMRTIYGTFSDKYASKTFDRKHGKRRDWTFASAVVFAVTTLTTIGYGTPSPQTPFGRIFCVFYGLFGIPLTLVTVADLAKFFGGFLLGRYRSLMRYCRNQKAPANEIEAEALELLEFDMPISWVYILLLLYPVLGATCISIWEGWSYLESFYFCFISVLTIGFGDYYPSNTIFYLLTVLFLILGLIITTMCVDLVAGQYIEKVHFFGRKLGLAREQARSALKSMSTNAQLLGNLMRMPMFRFGKNAVAKISTPYSPKDWNRIKYADADSRMRRDAASDALLQTEDDVSDSDDLLDFL